MASKHEKYLDYVLKIVPILGAVFLFFLGMQKGESSATEERHLLEQTVEYLAVELISMEDETERLDDEIDVLREALARVETKLDEVKDDTKTTYSLVHDWVRER